MSEQQQSCQRAANIMRGKLTHPENRNGEGGQVTGVGETRARVQGQLQGRRAVTELSSLLGLYVCWLQHRPALLSLHFPSKQMLSTTG